ncbi:class I SAM-dependent methyltransferase [Algicola sagamiensis]|uniref:class I SAM-dependent methyltransferase n=1 Tax=Algicola sagamiensis TaxID=163869 RepID=UPI0003809A3A|nr:class I SAM-dependent methyltransferase [Algicola sagamiensis]
MKPAVSPHDVVPPEHWEMLPKGDKTRSALDYLLLPWLPQFFGYHYVTLGQLSSQIDCSATSIKHRVEVGLWPESNILSDLDALPFLEHSIDLVISTHALEFCADPHHTIREIHRILLPGGVLVLSGIHPVSLFGLVKIQPFKQQAYPYIGRFFTPGRVKDWLALLGFEILFDTRFDAGRAYRVDDDEMNWTGKLQDYAHQFLGGHYLIIAKKRVLPLTPIRPKWRVRPHFNPAVKSANA